VKKDLERFQGAASSAQVIAKYLGVVGKLRHVFCDTVQIQNSLFFGKFVIRGERGLKKSLFS